MDEIYDDYIFGLNINFLFAYYYFLSNKCGSNSYANDLITLKILLLFG
jgi:hypothetical protein